MTRTYQHSHQKPATISLQGLTSPVLNPTSPVGQEPYLWVFNRGERKGRKRAPSNVFTETDLYTIKIGGKKNYTIEQTLSTFEGNYATVFREKINKHLPLSKEEHLTLCAFVSIMLQRTLRHRDNLERFYSELIEHAEVLEKANGVEPKESERLKRFKLDVHKTGVVQLLPDITELLLEMSIAFLCTDSKSKFVTSDDPCNLFNPDLQWQRFYGPGLAQKHVQVTLPLSPNIMLCMSWSPLRGYLWWSKNEVEEVNRMVVGHCYKYFISNDSQTRRHWFRRYPLDFFFILKILKHETKMRWHKLKNWYKTRHDTKR